MSFTLEVTVAGLCVLVPDPNTNEMHVLMPNTHDQGMGCMTQHEARIYFDPKYLLGGPDRPDEPPVNWQWNDLLGGSLGLACLGSAAPVVPAQVLRVGASVHPQCLESGGGGRLDARITLSNTTFVRAERGSIWSVPGTGDTELTFQATWSMTVDATSLEWSVSHLANANTPSTTELFPVDTPAGPMLKVMIVHAEASELPGSTGTVAKPVTGLPPKHIQTCLKPIFDTAPIPDVRYVKELQAPGGAGGPIDGIGMVTTYSCMITSGDMP